MLKAFRETARASLGINLVFIVVAAILFYGLYCWHLGSLTNGVSPTELVYVKANSSISMIFSNPVYLPHKLLQYGLSQVHGTSPFSLRLASVICTAVLLVGFYSLATRWFGRLIAFVGTVILAATPWIILAGRSVTPEILLLAPATVLALYYWLSHEPRWTKTVWLFFVISLGLSIYIPGLLLMLTVAISFNRNIFWSNIKKVDSTWLAIGGFIFAVTLIPLIYSLTKHPGLITRELFLIPQDWPAPFVAIKDFAWSGLTILVRAHTGYVWLVGRMPLLSALEIALLLFGVYALSQMARRKLYFIAVLIAYSFVVTSINGSLVYLTIALSPLILICTAGLRFLYLEWRSVFPRNPIPKYFAYGLIVSLALFQIGYGVRYALAAWPHLSSTKTVYVIK